MKVLKEKKGIIISFIIGVIIASSITVYATSYFAKDITYKEGKSVEDALNDLYKGLNDYEILETGNFTIPSKTKGSYDYYKIDFSNSYTSEQNAHLEIIGYTQTGGADFYFAGDSLTNISGTSKNLWYFVAAGNGGCTVSYQVVGKK